MSCSYLDYMQLKLIIYETTTIKKYQIILEDEVIKGCCKFYK